MLIKVWRASHGATCVFEDDRAARLKFRCTATKPNQTKLTGRLKVGLCKVVQDEQQESTLECIHEISWLRRCTCLPAARATSCCLSCQYHGLWLQLQGTPCPRAVRFPRNDGHCDRPFSSTASASYMAERSVRGSGLQPFTYFFKGWARRPRHVTCGAAATLDVRATTHAVINVMTRCKNMNNCTGTMV
eukprot:354820-Chlamydomonas_euryale.AAC.1